MTECRHTDPMSVRTRMQQQRVQLVDVRQLKDWQQERIPGAIAGSDLKALQALDRDVPTVVYCYRGNSSQPAAADMERAGFSDVASMDGGFTAWKELFGAEPEAVEKP